MNLHRPLALKRNCSGNHDDGDNHWLNQLLEMNSQELLMK
jgi:hypothetical protein